MISDFILQLYVQKQPQIEFQGSIKENYLYLSEKTIKMLLPFLTTYLHEPRFSSYTSTNTAITDQIQKLDEDLAILY